MEKQNLQFLEINPESRSTSSSLGITEERKELLVNMMEELFKSSDSTTEVLTALSTQVETPSELSWISFQCGMIVAKKRLSQLPTLLIQQMVSPEGFCNCPSCQERRRKDNTDSVHTMD